MSLEQAPVGCFLRQRMTKDIRASLGRDALGDEFETDQLAQLRFQRARPLPHRTQQTEREFPADHRGDLEKLFRFVRQAIDARHDDVMDRVRHHQVGSKVLCFTRVQRELLQEERDCRRPLRRSPLSPGR